MAPVQRHEVFRSDRILVTEELIRGINTNSVLEVGAGDYSFYYTKRSDNVTWTRVDFEPPCDVVCNLNTDQLTLPFDDASFDLEICTEVLDHLSYFGPSGCWRKCAECLAQTVGFS